MTPARSHYLKILLDAIFGAKNFRSEISWKRSSAHNDGKQGRMQYGNIRDVILFYTVDKTWTWNWQYTKYDDSYIQSAYGHIDQDGRNFQMDNLTAAKAGGDVEYPWPVKRLIDGAWEADLAEEYKTPKTGWEYKQVPPYQGRYWAYSKANMIKFSNEKRLAYSGTGMPRYKRFLDEMPGVPLQNDWSDITPASGKEDLGYPTQKPLALLERIIKSSSNEGAVILDPFCGCGTAIHAAQRLNRQWIGIDITHLAVSLIEKRLNDAFPGIKYTVHGTPKDVDGARKLAEQDKYQFQWWAVSLINAVPYGGKKKGADSGIDGFIYFKPDGKTTEKAIVSVKGGENVSVAMIRDLGHVVDREKAKVGIFITLAEATGPMKTEAIKAGFYETPHHGKVPKLQILTIADLFAGKKPQIPFVDVTSFKSAPARSHQNKNNFYETRSFARRMRALRRLSSE